MWTSTRAILTAGLALVSLASAADAQAPPDEFGRLYQPYLEVKGLVGDGPELVRPTMFVPLLQSPYDLVFADVTAVLSDADSIEVNAGIGYRSISTTGWIFGRYAYFDYLRTAHHNTINQATLGLEWMNVEWDFRINAYLPQESGEAISPRVALYDPQLRTIVVRRDEELAYYGTDVEVGYLLADWLEGDLELRGYAGGFYFDRNVSTFEAITGPRARLELRAFDLPLLGNGSRVLVGAQYQYDDERGSVGTALVSVRLPFGTGGVRPKLDRLQRRMLNPVVRDVNVIAQGGTRTEYALDPETGQRFGEVTLVDATTVDLPADVTAAGMNSTVFIDGSAGPIDVNAPILLETGQVVRGAGIRVIGEESRKRVLFGEKPVINGTDPGQDVFVLANQSTLRHTLISGGRNGIVGDSLSDIVITQQEVSDTLLAGMHLTGTLSGTISDNVVTRAGTDGIRVGAFSGGPFENNVARQNAGSGIVLASFSDGEFTGNTGSLNGGAGIDIGALSEVTLSRNTADSNGGNGFQLGAFDSGVIQDNSASSNLGDGFEVAAMGVTAGQFATFSQNTAVQNAGHGFHVVTHDGGTTSENTAQENGQNGFQFDNYQFGTTSANTARSNLGNGYAITFMQIGSFTGNMADGNGLHGLRMVTMNNGLVTDNTLTDNLQDGINIDSMFGQILNNVATGNLNGIVLAEFVGGFVNGNTTSRNLADGLFIADYNSGFLESNLADRNGDDGFDIGSTVWSFGQINDNTATNNPLFGFRIQNRDPGFTSASGNTATGNGDNTVP